MATSSTLGRSVEPAHATASPKSVLVVDDDPFMLDVLRDLLADIGVADVRAARGGDEALRAMQSGARHPDVVICDLAMPGKDGFLVMADLAERGFKGRVVVVSGMDARTMKSASLMAKFHRLNIVASLAKPVQHDALAAALRA